ncbi:kinase-like protein [Periconia macrospinosa]|uniref:non-specific serine/threonine protein kinase n=1 Tax=Periconia macrospinosa TaxID=97972 RepID=A0A2V1E6H6_9PLEO|nr:kinase-like protein [Periconia macrospinosa]
MASRASSMLHGEAIDHQQKANNTNQSDTHNINSSNRAFGLDGSYDDYSFRDRSLSRSPSPYRRKRTRSPSPYRRKRYISRSPSRSPSPYRHRRNDSRSPSPFRHNRGGRQYDGQDSRSQYKRKASPPRGGRPDKRHQIDRNRHNDRNPRSQFDDARTVLHSSQNDRRPNKPASYADNDGPALVPEFHDSAKLPVVRNGQDGSRPQVTSKYATGSQTNDVKMTSPPQEPDDTDDVLIEKKAPPKETLEEKKRRWAAIRAAAEKEKPKDNLLQQALLANVSEGTTPTGGSPAGPTDSSVSPAGSPYSGHLDTVPASPDIMVVDKQQIASEGSSPSANGPSAADYDPTNDMLDDRNRAAEKSKLSEISASAYSETDPKLLSTLPAAKAAPVKKQKKEFDMFDLDDDDDDDNEENLDEDVNDNPKGVVLDEKLLDNWDDPEGYYKLISNELVNDGRYRIIKGLGRGVFANVAQAEDVKSENKNQNSNLVAIKIIRRNDLMRVASQKEMDFVRKVNEADPTDRRHIIRLLSSFDHKGHLCGVFEHMSKNLRDLLKEDTNGHGLALQAVRTYARQMFIGLQHLQNCQVVHCDLKPDNILVSHDKKTIKISDFGTAVDKRDIMDRTEYLVSRFYRAPEIVLGMEIGYGIDMWAIGCTLYELWTGKILFTGRTNNQMIKAFMDCLGWPSEKLLKKGILQNVLEHFEAGPPLKFISREVDQHGIASVRKIEQQKKIARDLRTRVNEAARGIPGGPTTAELNDFADLLGACLHFNVEKRVQPKEALLHKFFPQPKLMPKPAVIKPPMVKSKRGGAHFRR